MQQIGQPVGTRLPSSTTELVGRGREIAQIIDLLRVAHVRLLTLTGAGGSGKTRLALAVADALPTEVADAVHFVDLAVVTDPGLVVSRIATAFGLRERSGAGGLLDDLTASLANQRLLVVLDNFEQVVAAAPLLADFLQRCPALKLLVTSRSLLRLSAEYEFVVPPLAVPNLRRLPEHTALAQYESVSLFVQRARALRPDFEVTTSNGPAIAEICARLDGLPLALELAAARVRLLPPHALRDRLGSRLGLLTGGPRDVPSRQQTLRGAIDWSYSLLDAPERALFARLAVFVGGATIEAIERVCGVDPVHDVLGQLFALVDHSLVRQWETSTGEPRFGMLETIREYALERLATSPEAAVLGARHSEWALAMAEEAEPQLTATHQAVWFDRLEMEHDNLRAALHWCIDQNGGPDAAVRIAGSLMWFWLVRGYRGEGRSWLDRALAAAPTAPALARAKALHGSAVLAWTQGYLSDAEPLLRAALALRRQEGDLRGAARSLANLASVKAVHQEIDEALTLFEESLTLSREVNDQHGMAMILNNLGLLARERGDLERSRQFLEEALAIQRTLGSDEGAARVLANLGILARRQGQREQAASHFMGSLRAARHVGGRDVTAFCFEGLADAAQQRGRHMLAARLLGAAEALRSAIGAPLALASDRDELEHALAAARAHLSEEEFSSARAEGQTLPLEDAIELALTVGAVSPAMVARHPADPLSPREREVAALVARGYTNRQIAEALIITEGTAGLHVVHILNKLGFHSRTEVAGWAYERRLIETPHQ